ncbi:MAG: hypothetical protein ACRD2L_24700, partial [Terriglobia bacterium]
MAEIKVDIRGNQFTLNNVPTILKMRTSFGITRKMLLGQVAEVEKWFDRVKRQGFQGIRLFGETDIWD